MDTVGQIGTKRATWFYRYEQDGIYPILQVGAENKRYRYQLHNPVDSVYLFCRIEVESDGSDGFKIEDIYSLEIPGNRLMPDMSMDIINHTDSPIVQIVVRDFSDGVVIEDGFWVGSSVKNEEMILLDDGDVSAERRLTEGESQQGITVSEQVVREAFRQMEEMPGLSGIKEEVERLVECVKLNQLRKENGLPLLEVSHHLVFTGNPGTGKTTVARLLGRIYAALGITASDKVVETDRSGLVEGFVGQTAVTTKEVLDSARGGILYIDEAYTLAKEGNDFGQEAIDTILKYMEDYRDDLVVIAAGYPAQMDKFINSNPGLRSRFKTLIHFQDYTGEELYEIFLTMCQKHGMLVEDGATSCLKEYFMKMGKNRSPQFANGREVRNFFEMVVSRQAHRIANEKNVTGKMLSTILVEDLGIEDDRELESEALKELMSMPGLARVKTEVSELVSLVRNQKQREEKGLSSEKISCHMVFTGNPGTGKTTVARIMAKILKSLGVTEEDKVVETDASMLVAGYVGQTAIKTKEVIDRAVGGVLFIDEAYALERSVGGFGQEAIDTLLKAMEDYREHLVVIAAGYEDEMERFIGSNPGLRSRFNQYIHFQDYSSHEMYRILERYCEKEHYRLEMSAMDTMERYMESHRELFPGNGRDVRKFFEELKKQQASRLGIGDYGVEELVRITKEDVATVAARWNGT